jgi:hypothetical protein
MGKNNFRDGIKIWIMYFLMVLCALLIFLHLQMTVSETSDDQKPILIERDNFIKKESKPAQERKNEWEWDEGESKNATRDQK